MHQIFLSSNQASKLYSQVVRKYRQYIEEDLRLCIPEQIPEKDTSYNLKLVKINGLYLADDFGALDLLLEFNGRHYVYTIEQSRDGKYCSALDPKYQHVAKEYRAYAI